MIKSTVEEFQAEETASLELNYKLHT